MNKIYHTFEVFITVLFAGFFDFWINTLFQDVLQQPLFFDTIFLIAILFAYGPLPAFLEYIVFISLVCVKLILLYGKTDNVFIYALSALTIIIITWLFIRKKENLQKSVNFTYLYLLSACICAGIACSIVSGFISYFTYELNIKDWNSDKIIFASHNSDANFLLYAIVGRIPLTVLDRIITTFTGFGVFKLCFYLKNKRGEGK